MVLDVYVFFGYIYVYYLIINVVYLYIFIIRIFVWVEKVFVNMFVDNVYFVFFVYVYVVDKFFVSYILVFNFCIVWIKFFYVVIVFFFFINGCWFLVGYWWSDYIDVFYFFVDLFNICVFNILIVFFVEFFVSFFCFLWGYEIWVGCEVFKFGLYYFLYFLFVFY